jgi:hypothetical protein
LPLTVASAPAMNNELSILIAYYEEEKNRLLGLLNGYLKESDYIAAHHSSKALHKVNHQLGIFYNLSDKLYHEKENLLWSIDSYEKQIESGLSEFDQTHYLKIIQEEKVKLYKLNQLSANSNHEEEDFLNKALIKLLDRKIKYFNLVLIKSKDIYFKFRLLKKQFVISLDNIKRHMKNYTLYEEQLKSLEYLGFEFSNNRDKLTLFVPYHGLHNTSSVKLILIKMVFEIFHFREFKDESYIEYKEKT